MAWGKEPSSSPGLPELIITAELRNLNVDFTKCINTICLSNFTIQYRVDLRINIVGGLGSGDGVAVDASRRSEIFRQLPSHFKRLVNVPAEIVIIIIFTGERVKLPASLPGRTDELLKNHTDSASEV
ncbi:ABC-type dipeptide oligopeptide nickel transport ATPase component, putative [Babesia ovata]|uniref:ABC-type dipeptide oligopeptide nickel transport ATPase component, putative n=1 Tax=Babesia ovata TaxID=189622 RepID=A0A2H6KJT0_9APIC|nr:ABC-type dipeptide oligopeptide nickel transport ATPase component, putative [Babesia ovata]GBE63255.1 ABC-type dipeptide oligopeptide nickel transport ATPase component, putative [Babesia ovata]